MPVYPELITIYDDSPTVGDCLARDTNAIFQDTTIKKIVKHVNKLSRAIYIKRSLLALNSYPPQIPHSPKCVIMGTGRDFGGTIVSLPLLEAVRKRWPNAHLIILTNTQQNVEIIKLMKIECHCYVFPTVPFNKAKFHPEIKRIKNELRQWKPEILIDNHNYCLIPFLIDLKIPIRIGHIGYNTTGNRTIWDDLYNIKVSTTEDNNWLASYSDLAKAFDAELPGYPTIKVSPLLQKQALALLTLSGLQMNQKTIAIQAGVSNKQWSPKQWPSKFLAKTCSDLWKNHSLVPIIFGVKGQEETFSIIKAEMPPHAQIINLIGKTSLAVDAGILSLCVASITNDSGMMHFSAAVGTPTVATYGMTKPELTWCYATTGQHRIIRRKDIRPCYTLRSNLIERCTDRRCLTGINHETVTKAVLDLVNLI